MKHIPLKIWLMLFFIITFAGLAVASTFLFRGILRDQVVLPLLEVIYIIRRFISSLNRDLVWSFFLLLMFAGMMLTLPSLGRKPPPAGVYSDKRSRSGRLLHWLSEVRELQSGKYITRYTTLELKKLLINTVAFRQQCSLRQAELWLSNPENQRRIPLEVHQLLQAGHPGQSESNTIWQKLKAWLLRYPSLPKTAANIAIEPILSFLEAQDGKEYP